MACATQWRSGANGREGLDYSGVQHVIESRRVWRKRRAQHFVQVQIMERAALRAWAERDAR